MQQIISLLAQSGVSRAPWTLVGLVILILDIAVIISVLAGRGTAGHKLLWSIIVLLFPVLGLVLYFVFGRSRADRPLLD